MLGFSNKQIATIAAISLLAGLAYGRFVAPRIAKMNAKGEVK